MFLNLETFQFVDEGLTPGDKDDELYISGKAVPVTISNKIPTDY